MLDSLRRIANITSSHQAINNNNNIKATHKATKLGSLVCVNRRRFVSRACSKDDGLPRRGRPELEPFP